MGSGFEPLEDRTVPSTTVFTDTYSWTGTAGNATVTVTVTEGAPGYAGKYLWNYHVTNNSFSPGYGAETFGVWVGDPADVTDLGTSQAGWEGTVGLTGANEYGGPNTVGWQGGEFLDRVEVGESADFWFTTNPTAVVLSNTVGGSFAADGGFASFVEGPVAAPAPALIVTTEVDVVANDGLTSLREAIDYANLQTTTGLQRIAFASDLAGKTFKLNSQLPNLEKNIFIDGLGKNLMTIERDTTKGGFSLFGVLATSASMIEGVTLHKGLVDFSNNGLSGGGAIWSLGHLVVENCAFLDNKAVGTAATPGRGGAIWAVTGSLTVIGSSFDANEAEFGGAICIGTGFDGQAKVTLNVSNSVFSGNMAYKSGGGDLHLQR